MRVLTLVLIPLVSAFFSTRVHAEDERLCGVFKGVAYAPEGPAGDRLILNPHAVTPVFLLLSSKKRIQGEQQGALLEVEIRLTGECLRECAADLVQVLRRVPPFERYAPFQRSAKSLVRKEPC